MKDRVQLLFQKNNIKQTLLDLTFVLFLLSLLFQLTKQIFNTYSFDDWNFSEFLINYQGGFVRRGLLGEILFHLTKSIGINLEWTVKIISLICFFAVCIFFIRAFLKKGYELYILPLCFFLGMGILSDVWLRKDYLMLYSFILILKTYQANYSIILKLILINIFFCFILLTHEVVAFFSLPAVLLLICYLYKDKGIKQAISISLIALSPSICCFLLTLYFHGNLETAQKIWDSWQFIASNNLPKILTENSWNSVASLGWKSDATFKAHFTMNFLAFDIELLSLFVWLVTVPIVYYLASNFLVVFRKTKDSFTGDHKMALSSILIFQLLSLAPVFTILSCDFVRVFFYWIASSFAVFLIVPTENVAYLTPPFYAKYIIKLNNSLSNIMFPNKTNLVFLMLFIGISSYQFFVDLAIKNSMIYNVFFILSKPFVVLNKLEAYL